MTSYMQPFLEVFGPLAAAALIAIIALGGILLLSYGISPLAKSVLRRLRRKC